MIIQKNVANSIPASYYEAASKIINGQHSLQPQRALVKSPLRYPGGKSRAIKYILDLLPQGLDTLCSPFLGGASIELACASKLGIRVYGYDIFSPVVNFWQCTIENPRKVAKAVMSYHPLTRSKFYALQKRYNHFTNPTSKAAVFYALNRASFSGTTLSGGMSPNHPRFNQAAIDRLNQFSIDGFSVDEADFSQSIPKHKNDFLYLDPPYANGGRLYGKKGDCHMGFDHAQLADLLKSRDGWILSYNDCEEVRDLYNGYRMLAPEWIYGMSNGEASKELIILSRDL